MAVLSVGLIAALAAMFANGLAAYWQADRAWDIAHADKLLFEITQATRLSRGASQNQLVTLDQPASRLDEIRADTQARLEHVLTRVEPLLTTQERERSDAIRAAWGATAPLHAELLVVATKPRTQRDLKDTDAWYKAVGSVVSVLSDLSLTVAGTARWIDPVIGENVLMRQSVWNLRESLGEECSTARPAFGTNTPLTPMMLRATGELRAAARATDRTIENLVARPGVPAELAAAAQFVKTEMRQGFAIRDKAYGTLGTPSALSPDAWNTACTGTLERIVTAATASIERMADRASGLRAEARQTLILTGAVLALAIIVGATGLLLARRQVALPLRQIMITVKRLAELDYATPIRQPARRDEFHVIATTLEQLRQSAADGLRLADERIADHAAKAERATKLDGLVRAFEHKIGGMVQVISTGSTTLEATARTMSATATRTNGQAATVASAAEEASVGVSTVAAAAEQLSASIGEISRQVSQSATITGHAVLEAQRTDTIVRTLAEAADRIGQVIELISSIARQTNLLALNATIEAARAGDAGKGFAVVASEVKSLAQQTASATSGIASQVEQIQAATKDAVEAIRTIAGTIGQVSAIAIGISAAVEEQGAATAEIARNVQQTASATQHVTVNIADVSKATVESGTTASLVLGAATDLSRQSEYLTSEVHSFIDEVRAA